MPPAGFKRSCALWERRTENWSYYWSPEFWRAILYELQPVRFTKWVVVQDQLVAGGRQSLQSLIAFGKKLPLLLQEIISWLRKRTLRQWQMVFGALLYYMILRWIHSALEAGPIVLIVTLLVVIFTIGLSDNQDGMPSAYSVFNKGFQKLLGSVDEEALLQQHVGGGGMAMMMMGGAGGRPQEAAENDAPERGAARNQRINREQDEMERDGEPEQPQPGARRSRKKRGGRSADQRREIQRQREAAAALGFGDEDEAIAMNLLVGDQVLQEDH